MMDGRLRILAPYPTQSAKARPSAKGLFRCCALAIVIQFTLSANVLKLLGYTGTMHPATMFPAVCALYGVLRGIIPLHQRLRDAPGLMVFLFGIPVVMLYSMFFNGVSGSTVFIQSFWSAGILALLLETATAKQKRLLGSILVALVVGNVLIGLYESATETVLFPLVFDREGVDRFTELIEDFRPRAFYDDPLSASLVTSMAIFLLYSMRIRLVLAAPVFALMVAGLLAYGGRTALAVTVIVSAFLAIYELLAGLVKRKLNLGLVLAVGLAVIVIPLVITQTTIADGIIYNWDFGDGAEWRLTQWDIFNYLSMKDWLFGISKDQLTSFKYQLGSGGKDACVGSFWILIFLDLGVLGFSLFVAVFVSFLLHLGRYAKSLNGWLLIGCALVIDSASASLGGWSNDLFLETAFVMAIAGFSGYRPVPVRRRAVVSVPAPQPIGGRPRSLALTAAPLDASNLRGD
jgi:hypothetical protein